MDRHKVSVLTGSNKGLGFGLLTQLLQREEHSKSWKNGYTKVFACCRDPDNTPSLIKLQEEHPDVLVLVQMDLGDSNSIREAAALIGGATSHIDLLLNNAAHLVVSSMESPDLEEQITRCFQVNCTGPLLFTHLLLPLVKQGEGKRIVNVSSVSGSIGGPFGGQSPHNDQIGYKMSKAALNMMSATLASGLKDDNIIVISVNPGGIMSETVVQYLGPSIVNEERGWMRPEVGAAKLLRIADAVTIAETGKFINHRYLDESDPEYKTFYSY